MKFAPPYSIALAALSLLLIACGTAAPATPRPTATVTAGATLSRTLPAATPIQAIGSVGTLVPEMSSREHVPAGTSVTYSTTPPTSGPHWPTWMPCGVFQETPDELLVHNLEHGNIVVSYRLADTREVDRLVDAVQAIREFRQWGIVRPYPRLEEGTVAVTAWGVIETFRGADAQRLARFFQEHAGKRGPERIPCS